ncbi:fibropellin-3-like, partial [Ruditapes philippinarum]|uniref:fibropellin-3-like n=1 Tax=Ruditapes philippinarum TaxID=129788 RepID=UPI00295BF95E
MAKFNIRFLFGLILFGTAQSEWCSSVHDCHATNCRHVQHLGLVLQCENHLCICEPAIATTAATSACKFNHCYHGGSCHEASNHDGYTCSCLSGFTGSKCQYNHHCDNNPCKNNGVCHLRNNDPYYICTCPTNYTGPTCEKTTACISSPCVNGGACHVSTRHPYYYCRCATGFEGDHCQTVSPCHGVTCYNHGVCKTS